MTNAIRNTRYAIRDTRHEKGPEGRNHAIRNTLSAFLGLKVLNPEDRKTDFVACAVFFFDNGFSRPIIGADGFIVLCRN